MNEGTISFKIGEETIKFQVIEKLSSNTRSYCRNDNASDSDDNEEKKKSDKKFKEVVGTSNRASSSPQPPDEPSKPDVSSFPSSEVESTTPEIPSSEPKLPSPRSNQEVMDYIFGLNTRWEDQFNKLLACFDKLSSSLNPG